MTATSPAAGAANDPLRTGHYRSFLGKTWALTKPYWQSEEKWQAWGLLLVIIALSLGGVYLSVWFNQWYNDFYNTLQNKDAPGFWLQISRFCPVALIYIVVAVANYYLSSMLQIRWRRWLTDVYFERWLKGRAYYLLEVSRDDTDNPDQRIAEDIDSFTTSTLSISLGLLSNIVSLFSFVFILWGLSGPLSFTVAGHAVSIPGYMVWVALLYAIAGSWLTHRVGRKLIKLNFDQQRYEANMRFAMVRVRENSERIALYQGEEQEQRNLRQRFHAVWSNFWSIMRVQKNLTAFTSAYGQIAIIFPLVVAAPRYFGGAIQLGGLMQISSAFGQVQGALSWLVDSYSALARWRSVVDRLTTFNDRLDSIDALHQHSNRTQLQQGGGISIRDTQLRLPNEKVLLNIASLTLEPGQHTLINAPSGSGKSVLLRMLAGIWPWWTGQVQRPENVMFLPQLPYLPIDTLRQALAYPQAAEDFDDQRYQQVLQLCKLEPFIGMLDESRHWAQSMSPGEQQRVAIARALLKKPQWLFLDEATSALDIGSEQQLYQVLRQQLPDTTLVSIAHRTTLRAFHQQEWQLAEGRLQAIEPQALPV